MTVSAQLALSFDGQCEAAFDFYARCFGGTVTFMLTWGDSPMASEVPPQWQGKVCHASLQLGDTVIAGSDAPGQYQRPQGFEAILNVEDPDAAERVFGELAQGGAIKLPLQETFWARRYGIVVDRFGIPWSVNCERAAGAAPA